MCHIKSLSTHNWEKKMKKVNVQYQMCSKGSLWILFPTSTHSNNDDTLYNSILLRKSLDQSVLVPPPNGIGGKVWWWGWVWVKVHSLALDKPMCQRLAS